MTDTFPGASPDGIEENVPLSPLTTLGLGGPARYFMRAKSEDAIREAIRFAKKKKLPLWILGGGSNTIFPDSGFPGLVVRMELEGLTFRQRGDRMAVTVAAGEQWDAFTRLCARNGYAGIESLAGIPGAAGAVPVQNVGAYGSEVGERIVTVRAMDLRNGQERRFSAEECGFAYRSSRFKTVDRDRYAILDVEFLLDPEGTPVVRYPELESKLMQQTGSETIPSGRKGLQLVRETVLALRRSKSMVLDPSDPDSRSAGSFFTNPILSKKEYESLCKKIGESDHPPFYQTGTELKLPAAWLVEHSGFPKGFRMGGVGVSSKHALALVNYNGSAAELLELSDRIIRAVRDRFGVQLEREPVLALAGDGKSHVAKEHGAAKENGIADLGMEDHAPADRGTGRKKRRSP